MLELIQTVHTFTIVWIYICLVYMIWAHWTGTWSRMLYVSYGCITLEAIAIIPFGLKCPLTLLVHEIASPQTNDSFVPFAVAEWVMPVGIALWAVSMLIVGVKWTYLRSTGAI